MNKELIKCYEFDFGDVNVIEQDIDQLLAWIKSDALDLKEGDEPLEYKIVVKFLTKEELDNLPEWS